MSPAVLAFLQGNPALVASLLRALADQVEKDPSTIPHLLAAFGVKSNA